MNTKRLLLPEIRHVTPNSIAYKVGIQAGDKIVCINRELPQDFIDYKFVISDTYLEIKVKRGKKYLSFKIEKDYDTDIGLNFESSVFDGVRLCNNNCIFCFVHQLPPGMRGTLYLKDDDYRLSVLFGNFITLTNLSDDDINRIKKFHLGPLYVSVHTTDPDIRQLMLKNPEARHIMKYLRSLAEAGITIHTQIVLCPGINDRKLLVKSIVDLAELWPSVQSIGIVPVGLTNNRQQLYPLRGIGKEDAQSMIKQVDKWQEEFNKIMGYPFVFLADEFYHIASVEIPGDNYYGGYPQVENGIGITRQFLNEMEEVVLPKSLRNNLELTILTGRSGYKYLKRLESKFNSVRGLKLDVIVVDNTTFGNTVTVTGLIGGKDILTGIDRNKISDIVVIPDVMLKDEEGVFIDDMTISELEKHLGCAVVPVSGPVMLGEKIIEWGR